jgi:hypothetical protein
MDFEADLTQKGLARAALLRLLSGCDTELHADVRLPLDREADAPDKFWSWSRLHELARYRLRYGADDDVESEEIYDLVVGATRWARWSATDVERRIALYWKVFAVLVNVLRRAPLAGPPLHENENLAPARARIVTLASAPGAPPASPSCLKPNEGLQTAA